MFDSAKAHEAQTRFCEERETPHFAPGPHSDYRCHRCNQNIYAEKGHPVAARLPRGKIRLDYTVDVSGISVEDAGQGLVCGCPFCYASFDD